MSDLKKQLNNLDKQNGFKTIKKDATAVSDILSKAFNFAAIYQGGKRVISTLSGMTKESVDFVEQVNLFNVSFGKGIEGLNGYYEHAIQFQEELEKKLQVNIAESMQYQALFNSMSKSMGISAKYANILSENFTKMGYDLASLYNINPENAMQKLRAGLAGQTKPLRDLGLDITQQSLQPIAESLGIDRSIKNMSQAEKMVLRYIAVLKQAQIAQGDFANTMDSPANQLRIFNAQVVAFKRNMGNLWQGFLGGILPYINATMMVINELLKMAGKLFGFKISEQPINASANVGVDDLVDGLGTANKKAKELKSQLMGFDEINNITLPDNTSGGSSNGASVGGIDQRLLDAMGEYDNLMDGVKNKATEIRDKMMEWLGFVRNDDGTWKLGEGLTNLEKILDVAKGIGLAILSWTVSSKFAKFLSALGLVERGKALNFALGFTLAVTGAHFLWNGTKHLMDGDWDLFTVLETMFGAGATSLGIASMIKASKLGKTVGWGKAFTIGLGISFALQGFEVLTNGFKKNDLKQKILGSLELGAGISIAFFPTLKKLAPQIKNLGLKAVGATAGIAGLALSLGNAYEASKKYANGAITAEERTKQLGLSIGGAAVSGAVIGSTFGPAGMAIGALAGALGVATANSIGMKNATQDCSKELGELEAITNSAKETYEEYVQSHIDKNKELEKTYETSIMEANYATDLKQKLDKIVDSNGHIIKGYEERADIILGELGQALGIELGRNGELITKNGEVIGSYGELSTSISDLIAKKKQEAKIEVITERYKEALRSQYELQEKRKEIQDKLNEAIAKEHELVDKNATAEQLEQARKATHECAEELQSLNNEIVKNTDTMKKFDYEISAAYMETKEEVKKTYDEIAQKAKETKGAELTYTEDNNAKILALAKSNMQEFLAMYDSQSEGVHGSMLAVASTIDTYGPELQKKWVELASTSVDDFTKALSEVDPTVQTQILSSITATNGMSEDLATAWANLAEKSQDEFKKTLNKMDDTTRGTILASIATTQGYNAQYNDAWRELADKSHEEFEKALSQVPEDTKKQIMSAIVQIEGQELSTEKAVNKITNKFDNFKKIDLSPAARKMMQTFGISIDSNKQIAINTADSIGQEIFRKLNIDTYGIGYNIGSGISIGMQETIRQISKTVSNVTSSIIKTFTGNLIIKSPSRKMKALAKNVPLGVAEGIDDGAKYVCTSMENLTDKMTIDANEFKISTEDIIDFKELNGNIQAKTNLNINSNLSQDVYTAIIRGLKDTEIPVSVEARVDEGIILKKIRNEAKEFEMQTGKPAFEF